jgi:outer membrane scaffolding protein for murein synthesis (MipA/OmpV family)
MRRLALAGALACALAGSAVAEERPLWEAGVGVFGFAQPDYRGANQGRGYVFPIPYFAYRGDRFKVDREGIRGLLFEGDRVQLDISLYATPPVDSSGNSARQGMPNLDATVEVGPVVDVTLAEDDPKDWSWRLRLRLPVRATLPITFSDYQFAGWIFWPHLNLDTKPTFLGGRWNMGINAGPLFGSQKYHEYFYGVQAQYARPGRPEYQASGGYSGMTFLGSMSRRFDRYWLGAYVRYDNLSGAVFDDSPLVKRNSFLAAGVAIAWVFSESSTRVYSEY